jgi:L-proline amide hydrolase
VSTTPQAETTATGEGQLRWRAGRTWYRIVGELRPGETRAPVVICHGGPGATHDYIESVADLSRSGRACILYDQIGNGRSEHMRDAPATFWTPGLFKEELVALTEALGIAGRYHVVGQSWGGMLAMEHALTHPAGLLSIVVADSPASMRLWVEEANRLREELPPDVQEALTRHERDGTTDSKEYEDAVMVFYRRHLCRLEVWPDGLNRSFAAMAEDPTVYHTMNGPSEFHVIGSLKDWDITARLHEIDVPTLLVSGRHDEATPLIVGEIHRRIPGAEWVLLEESSHSPQVEEPEAFLTAVEGFLAKVESG